MLRGLFFIGILAAGQHGIGLTRPRGSAYNKTEMPGFAQNMIRFG